MDLKNPGRICLKCGSILAPHYTAMVCPECAIAATVSAACGRMGPYSLEEEIGRGGMGVVYIGVHEKTGRVVAVKTPLVGSGAKDLRRRFAIEAEVLASLDHPGILPVYEVGEDRGMPYYAMKLAEENLAEKLAGLRDNWRLAADLMAGVAEAVHYAHQRGVLHRDLKPQNILLDEAGRPMVADFGLARLIGRETDLTQNGGIVGTPQYVAPEIVASGPGAATVASDVFSLGAIFYHCLTGRAPFHGESLLGTLANIAKGEFQEVRYLNGRVPEDLQLICHRCLEADATGRYESAADLAADLRAWQQGRPLLVRPLTLPEKSWKVVRRNPVVSALVFMVACTGITAAVAVWTSHERALVAERNRADAAERLASERLLAQCKVEAENFIRSGKTGQRIKAMKVLRQAWDIRHDPDLRGLAIQALSLADLIEPSGEPRVSIEKLAFGAVKDAVSEKSGLRALVEKDGGRGVVIESPEGQIVFRGSLAGRVSALAWNPAGNRLAIATEDKHLYLWNVGDTTLERRMSTRESPTHALAWHPERELVACLTQDGFLRLWDLPSGDDLVTGSHAFPPGTKISWDNSGENLLCDDVKVGVTLPAVLRMFRPSQFEHRMEDLTSVSLSLDDRFAAVVSESGAHVWDLSLGRIVAVFQKQQNEWLGIRWLPEAALVGGWNSPLRQVSYSGMKGTITSRDGLALPADDGCTLADLSRDGRWAALLHTSLHRFLLRSLTTGELVSLSHQSPYWITLSERGDVAATSSFQTESIRIWSVPEGRLLREWPFRMSSRLDLSPDGSRLLATSGRKAVEFSCADGTELRSIDCDEEVRLARYLPNSNFIVIATNRAVQLHQESDGKSVARLTIPHARAGESEVSVGFSLKGDLLAVQLANSSLALWDLSEIERELISNGMTL